MAPYKLPLISSLNSGLCFILRVLCLKSYEFQKLFTFTESFPILFLLRDRFLIFLRHKKNLNLKPYRQFPQEQILQHKLNIEKFSFSQTLFDILEKRKYIPPMGIKEVYKHRIIDFHLILMSSNHRKTAYNFKKKKKVSKTRKKKFKAGKKISFFQILGAAKKKLFPSLSRIKNHLLFTVD